MIAAAVAAAFAARRAREEHRHARHGALLARAVEASGSDGDRAALAAARALSTVARARRALPEDAGPYHGSLVALRALSAMGALSPSYLAAYLAWLDDLAAISALEDDGLRVGEGPRPLRRRKRGGP